MGGGRTKDGTPIYRRRNGKYERIDGKQIRHRMSSTIDVTDSMMINPRSRASRSPLPRNGREVVGFLQSMMALDNLNDKTSGSYLSKSKRTDGELYQKLIRGEFKTENGGFLFQKERSKNSTYLKHNDLPGFQDVMKQIMPQLTPQNLKQIIRPPDVSSSIDGRLKMWVFETFVTNNIGERIRTYVKMMPFHSNDGKPYMILVSMHRTGPVEEKVTRAEKGL